MKVTRHGQGGYRSGCRCATCYQAESDRKRAQRERELTGNSVAPVTALPTITPSTRRKRPAVGEVEAAVRAEVEPLPKAAESPGLVEAAIALARILDSSDWVSMHPATCGRLQAVLHELHAGPKRKSGGRLAAVQTLTAVRR